MPKIINGIITVLKSASKVNGMYSKHIIVKGNKFQTSLTDN